MFRGTLPPFLEAIRTCGRPVADIEEGHISTASCIHANLSQRLGRTLTWDATRQLVERDDEPTGCYGGRTSNRGLIRECRKRARRSAGCRRETVLRQVFAEPGVIHGTVGEI